MSDIDQPSPTSSRANAENSTQVTQQISAHEAVYRRFHPLIRLEIPLQCVKDGRNG